MAYVLASSRGERVTRTIHETQVFVSTSINRFRGGSRIAMREITASLTLDSKKFFMLTVLLEWLQFHVI